MSKHDRKWTEKELTWLRTHHAQVTHREAAQRLERSPRSVWSRARRAQLKFKPSTEIAYPGGKTVQRHAWTQEEVARLVATCEKHRLDELMVLFQRNEYSLRYKLKELGLDYQGDRPLWSLEEVGQLLDLAADTPLRRIAQTLQRPLQGVRCKLASLGVRVFQGSYSLSQARRATGYAVTQLERARDALGQTWQRRPHSWTDRYLISEDQLDALCEYLKTETWRKKKEVA